MIKILEKIWLLLVIFTIFAFLLGKLELISSFMVGVLLLTTFIKAQLVIDYFMDLKNIQGKYRFIPTIWLISVISLIAIAYY